MFILTISGNRACVDDIHGGGVPLLVNKWDDSLHCVLEIEDIGMIRTVDGPITTIVFYDDCDLPVAQRKMCELGLGRLIKKTCESEQVCNRQTCPHVECQCCGCEPRYGNYPDGVTLCDFCEHHSL
jgi:hypothetical protein